MLATEIIQLMLREADYNIIALSPTTSAPVAPGKSVSWRERVPVSTTQVPILSP